MTKATSPEPRRQLNLFDPVDDQHGHRRPSNGGDQLGHHAQKPRRPKPSDDGSWIYAFIAPSLAEFERLTAADSTEAAR